ncbi:MAG TPA: hypothetical protein QGH10_06000, partial [Armatimonadota bacterium]|nr:hypothetical protein [Armatimonadota bacterium]
MCRFSAVVFATVLAAMASAQTELTEFIEPIRAQHGEILALEEELSTFAALDNRWDEQDEAMRARLLAEVEAFRELMRSFCGAETRAGLGVELALLEESFLLLMSMEQAFGGVVTDQSAS